MPFIGMRTFLGWMGPIVSEIGLTIAPLSPEQFVLFAYSAILVALHELAFHIFHNFRAFLLRKKVFPHDLMSAVPVKSEPIKVQGKPLRGPCLTGAISKLVPRARVPLPLARPPPVAAPIR